MGGGGVADVAAACTVTGRALMFHAATGIPAVSAANATMAFVLIERRKAAIHTPRAAV